MSKIIVPATKLPIAVIQDVSAKTGNSYHRLEIDVDENYTIKKLLSNEEVELLRIKLSKPVDD